jgi:HSP20 family protein
MWVRNGPSRAYSMLERSTVMAEVSVMKQERDPLSRWFESEMPFLRGNLFGVNPFALMRHFVDDMDRTFVKGPAPEGVWCPAVEVREKEGKLMVTAELPGLTKSDVKVTVTGDTLAIEGERKHEKEDKKEGYYHSERFYGKFYRSIPLPEGAKAEQAAANFHDGILEISIPVPEKKEKSKEIPVQEVKAKAAA